MIDNKLAMIRLAQDAHKQLMEWRKRPQKPEIKKPPNIFRKAREP